MIKANELRIGNWVLADLPNNGISHYKIDAIDICVAVDKPEKYSPIPLSTEILVSCGFDLKKGLLGDPYYKRGEVELKETKNGFIRIEVTQFDTYRFDRYFKYLHELQNLVSAMTGEELQFTPPPSVETEKNYVHRVNNKTTLKIKLMLVNVRNQRGYVHSQILSLIGQGGANVATQEGIYMCSSFSFGNQISEKHNDYPELDDNYKFSPYGVCDNVEQVLERYKQWLELPDRKFCISFTKVTKAEQPPQYGWRWHKWGEYIGTKEPQHEYLYDEGDDIQDVYCYHIYEILN